MVIAGLVSRRTRDHVSSKFAEFFARRASMPGKSIVMAVVLSGWLIAAVIAFMIVAYASFFGVGVTGLGARYLSFNNSMKVGSSLRYHSV